MMTQDTRNMVLQTAMVPETLDLELCESKNLMGASSAIFGTALQGIVYGELDRMRKTGSVLAKPYHKPEVRVVRSIWVSKDRDTELQTRAFQRGQTKGELIIDMISREVYHYQGSLEVGI